MSWIPITVDDVLDRICDNENDAYEETGEALPVVRERLPGIIAQVTSHVRGKVAACSKNTGKMGAAGTIPDECLFSAIAIIRHALISTQPTAQGITENREKELEAANKFLDQVASCDVAITDPSGNYPGEPIDTLTPAYGGKKLLCF